MPRPRASAQQQQYSLGLWSQGLTVRAAHIELQKEFNEPVSHGTVQNWFRRFREGDRLLGNEDQPFRWSVMSSHGLPAEAGGVLMKVASLIGEWGDRQKMFNWRRQFSFRDAKWMWRVYCAVDGRVSYPEHMSEAPSSVGPVANSIDEGTGNSSTFIPLPFDHWLELSTRFSMSEWIHHLTGLDVDSTGYERDLMYRYWESTRHKTRVDEARASGAIPPPDLESQVNSFYEGYRAATQITNENVVTD
jgi:hypothetical protein